MNHAILAAGGTGTRFAGDVSKQFTVLRGKALLLWSLQLFEDAGEIDEVVLAYSAVDGPDRYRSVVTSAGLKKVRFVEGGATRFESVRNAFRSLRPQSPRDCVLIHDGARPLLTAALVARVLACTHEAGTALPVLPIQETMKEVEHDLVIRTWPREKMCVAQTPQGFRYDILQQAYAWADEQKATPGAFTDEALLVEKAGFPVRTVPGEKRNLKITEPQDLKLASFYIEETK